MTEEWQKLTPEAAARFLAEINPHLAPVSFSADSTTIRSQKLPFYKDYLFLELTDLSTVPGARKYVLYKAGAKGADVNVVNWTNQTIYDTNEKAPAARPGRKHPPEVGESGRAVKAGQSR